MNLQLTKIGNSQGIRIPKPILEQCGFKNTVSVEVREHILIIKPARECRKGWDKAFKLMHKNKDDELLDRGILKSEFDDK
jgi:antitoxin MazE